MMKTGIVYKRMSLCRKHLCSAQKSFLQTGSARSQTATAIQCPVLRHRTERTAPKAIADTAVKTYDQIPKVKGHPILGTLLDYTPMRQFKIDKVYELWRKRHEEYGTIYREKLPNGAETVFCSSADDVTTMFRYDSEKPVRGDLEFYGRLKLKAGLDSGLPMYEGDEWLNVRRIVNKMLLSNSAVWKCMELQKEVCQDFMTVLQNKKDENNKVHTLSELLSIWSLEMSGTFSFGSRLGILDKADDPEVQHLMQCNDRVFSYIANCLHGLQLWRFYDTKELKDAAKCLEHELNFIRKVVDRQSLENDDFENSLIFKLMQNLGEKQAYSVFADLFLGSIDTTAKACSLVLYALTVNSQSQETLRAEVQKFVSQGNFTGRELHTLPYMNAFLKEVYRVFPFSFVFSRVYNRPVVISGYEIPAGTQVLNTANSTQRLNPEVFPEPEAFSPERWLSKGCPERGRVHLTGPFGMGNRACPGRQVSMQQIRLLLIEILLKYRVESHHHPITSVFRATGCPSDDPKLSFIPLK